MTFLGYEKNLNLAFIIRAKFLKNIFIVVTKIRIVEK